MIRYPDGSKPKTKHRTLLKGRGGCPTAANRGRDLENDINLTNEYYHEKDLCLITKRPTPINVVTVDYAHGATITHAYFEKQSTTDYNGVIEGRYIDFEVKSTLSRTSFPLANITEHQLLHLEGVIRHGGVAFFIIAFTLRDEYYLLDAKIILDFIKTAKRRSMPYSLVKEKGHLIKKAYKPRLDYLPIVKELYFKKPGV